MKYFLDTELALASSLCWSPEEAFKLHIAQAKLNVVKAETRLDDEKKDLAKAQRAEEQWRETGKETKVND